MRDMKKFSTFLIEEKNVHMEHLEDLVFNNGSQGAREAFAFISSIRDMLAGHSKIKTSATVKWDGAPAIFAGVDPNDGKFFVAKKGLFNTVPVMYKSSRDITNSLNGDLAHKFQVALKEFSKLGITSGIYQGDLMFTKGDTKKEIIDGETYLTFQPNTIVYAVPFKSELASNIRKAEIGVVWHTTYTGKTIQSMHASFGKSIVDKLHHVPSIWMEDATYKDVSGVANMTEKETHEINALLTRAGHMLRTIPAGLLKVFVENEELRMRIKTYNNSKIRSGEGIKDTKEHVRGLIDHIDAFFNKEESTKKTDNGKMQVRERRKLTIAPLISHIPELYKIYDFCDLLIQAKNILIKKMDMASSVGTFLRISSGFRVTTPEGYVAIDHLSGGAVKLVDRLEFSKANFSDEVAKGWQR